LGIDLNLAPPVEDAYNVPIVPNDLFLPNLNLAEDFIELDDIIRNPIVTEEEGPVSMVIDSMIMGTEGSYSDGVVNQENLINPDEELVLALPTIQHPPINFLHLEIGVKCCSYSSCCLWGSYSSC
jgi:hypothetical protein